MGIQKFIYQNVTLGVIKHKRIHNFLKFFYDLLYKNTPFNRDYRVKTWINKSNKFITKNKLYPAHFDGAQAYFTRDNVKFVYDPNVDGGGAPKYANDDCDKDILEYISKKFPNTQELVIFDIGANIGVYSLNLANKFPKAKIHAFEPVSMAYKILLKNVELNHFDNLSCHAIAISDKEQTLLMSNDEFTGNHIVQQKNKHASKVKAITLDSFTAKNNINTINIIKCDIEGAELLMLKGGLQSIQKFKPLIILEVFEQWTKRYNYEPEEIFTLLMKLGYSYKVVNKGLKQGKIKNLKKELRTSYNFVFETKGTI